MSRRRGVVAAGGAALAAALSVAPAAAHAAAPSGMPSNLGLCSPFLGSLPAPVDPVTGETLGGNARSGVNLLIIRYGETLPEHLTSPGQLYRVRAQEHPTGSAVEECLPRPRG